MTFVYRFYVNVIKINEITYKCQLVSVNIEIHKYILEVNTFMKILCALRYAMSPSDITAMIEYNYIGLTESEYS